LTARSLLPDIASPDSAKCCVNDDPLIGKRGRNVASACKLRSGSAPGIRVGRVAEYILRDFASREEVDTDGFFCPVRGVDPALIFVQASPVALLGRVLDGTSSVLLLVGRFHMAIIGLKLAGEGTCGRGYGASRTGMKCHCVRLLIIDALEDINLTTVNS
jgi:hypothetical protein